MKAPIQKIALPFQTNLSLFIKREDLLFPGISGNKYRKLKYNLIEAKSNGFKTLLTFGGAFSNHIAAVALSGKQNGFETIGVIRGEELQDKVAINPTLAQAEKNGMKFEFVSREEYRLKDSTAFIERLKSKYGSLYLLPEGGTNELAIKGCEEILTHDDAIFTHICCAVGTGGTISGIINTLGDKQKAIGFPALKGSFLSEDIRNFAANDRWELALEYHFGGYGKINESLVTFMNHFHESTGVPLDPVYTGKMMYGVIDMIKKGYFPDNSNLLAIHTGGLQGIQGMNNVLSKKQMPLLNYIG